RDYPYVLIIEDDHFWQLSGHPYRSIIPANHPRWALVRSVSKSLGPDLRVGLVGSDPLTASRLGAHIRSGAMWVSHLLQRLAYLLTTNPDTPALLAHASAEYWQAIARVFAALYEQGSDARAVDGVSVWFDLDSVASPVVQAMGNRGWLVRDGAEFPLASDEAAVHHIRVTIHQLSCKQLNEFVADLTAVLADSSPTTSS